jgi:sodium transport system permease protein
MSARWREISTLYRWELRSALRDRTIVINSIVLPIVLYPAMLWLIFTGITFVRGQTENLASRVALLNLPTEAQDLGARFRSDKRFEVVDLGGEVAAAEREIRAGALDAVVVFQADETGSAAGNVVAHVSYDGSRERSELARRRANEVVDAYRDAWLQAEAAARGVDPARWAAFVLERRNTASSRDMGAFILGLLLPVFFVVMVALGCLYPAIDSTAGERERSTWETLMTTSAGRVSIVASKYLAVTTLGGLAGLLNVLAMLLTIRGVLGPMIGETEAIEFSLSPGAVPILVVSAVLLAGMLAAGMMVFAAFARTFREGQSMVTPIYLAAILPVTFLGSPGTTLTLPLALVPVVNVALVVRESISGVFKPLEMLVSVGASLSAILLLIRLAERIIAFEDVMTGSFSGGLARFVKTRLRRQPAGARPR